MPNPVKNRSKGPLSGIRVVEIGMMIAGPMVGQNLADLGAEVIKIEPTKGDEVRKIGTSKDGQGLYWRVLARNKRVVAVDLTRKEGTDIVRRLIETADVLLENFRPGRLEEFGLDYDSLKAINPGLVLLHISGYGQTGPYSSRPGLGTLAEAFSGWSHLTGQPDGPPTLPQFPLADAVAALTGTYSVLACLLDRERNGGVGNEVDISLYEPLMNTLATMVIDYDQLGFVGNRLGNMNEKFAPRNTFRTRDGKWVVVSSVGSATLRLFRAIGRDDLATDETLATQAGRSRRMVEIDAILEQWCLERDQNEILKRFAEWDVIGGPVSDIEQLFADPHVAGRETIVTVDDRVLGPVRVQNIVPRLRNSTPVIDWLGPPEIGEHTFEVLKAAGYSEDEITRLERDRVIVRPDHFAKT